MGCDIHVSMEIMDKDGVWHRDERIPGELIPDERWYYVWGFLFGVRGTHDEIPYHYLGWPEDAVTEDSEIFHSHTVIEYDEDAFEKIDWPDDLKECYWRIFLEYVWGRFKKSSYIKDVSGHHFANHRNGYWDHPMRMVIAFDN